MHKRVYLIGLPAAGKTTTAKWLADKMGWNCVDLDQLIEEKLGKTIIELFQTEGEEYFRTVEAEVLRTSKNFSETIISCGGGTAAFHSNMDWMISHGMTIYLNTDLNVISSRIEENLSVRPMFSGLSTIEIKEKLTQILEDRAIFYGKSKIVWNKSTPTDMLHFAVSQLVAN